MSIISMKTNNKRPVYHKNGCIYEKRIKESNKQTVGADQIRRYNMCECKYCGGLRGYARVNIWEYMNIKDSNYVTYSYENKTNTMYLRTRVGLWKVYEDNNGMYILWHLNHFVKEESTEQMTRWQFHRQRDVKPTLSLEKIINYVISHDKAKLIIADDYHNLPRTTKKQRAYYHKTENKIRRQEQKRSIARMNSLFDQISSNKSVKCMLATTEYSVAN